MECSHLSFALSFPTLNAFVDHWAGRYYGEDRDRQLYDPYIGSGADRQQLSGDALTFLFEWKNGSVLSQQKQDSVARNYLAVWIEDAELEARYLDDKKGGGPVWNIFYLHCRKPEHYAIFDQHAYRAMVHIQGLACTKDLPDESSAFVYDAYRNRYLPFVKSVVAATGQKLRIVDRSLYTFGQFLKKVQRYS